jgi:hypothetical protein
VSWVLKLTSGCRTHGQPVSGIVLRELDYCTRLRKPYVIQSQVPERSHYVNHIANGFIIANQFHNYNSDHNGCMTEDSLDVAFDPRGMLVDLANKIH